MPGNFRKARHGDRLQVVDADAGRPIGDGERRRIAFEFGRAENRCGRHRHRRFENDVPRRRQVERLQRLADAFGESVATTDENRNIGAER